MEVESAVKVKVPELSVVPSRVTPVALSVNTRWVPGIRALMASIVWMVMDPSVVWAEAIEELDKKTFTPRLSCMESPGLSMRNSIRKDA